MTRIPGYMTNPSKAFSHEEIKICQRKTLHLEPLDPKEYTQLLVIKRERERERESVCVCVCDKQSETFIIFGQLKCNSSIHCIHGFQMEAIKTLS